MRLHWSDEFINLKTSCLKVINKVQGFDKYIKNTIKLRQS